MTAGPYRRRPGTAEGDDRAFWISLADMMTALMVLFLVLMAALMLTARNAAPGAAPPPAAQAQAQLQARNSTQNQAQPGGGVPAQVSAQIARELAAAADAVPGVRFDPNRMVVDFGDGARFATASHQIDAETAARLRAFVPRLLALAQRPPGREWLGRVLVEGYADPRGDYLYNLNLSLQRAQRVLCVLLEADVGTLTPLTPAQRQQVRRLFTVAGLSYNEQRDTHDASRRIELRVELGRPPPQEVSLTDAGQCRLPAG
ncbi:MAG: flagellar motor protein MotB [Hyphomonadaceae bacterium]